MELLQQRCELFITNKKILQKTFKLETEEIYAACAAIYTARGIEVDNDDLKKCNAENSLVKGWNAYGVDCKLVDCDYFDYVKGDSYAVNSFLGEYMLQYSWAEMTLGELLMKPESY